MMDVKMAFDKFNKILRHGDDIHSETNLSFDDLIDKYYNLTDVKLHKNHICILRDLSINDKEFNRVIEYYRNFSEESKLVDWNTPCENCEIKCCNNININFNFFAAVFVMDLHNRRFTYNIEIYTELVILFFKQFYIEENEIRFNEQRMINIFIDYDLEIMEKGLIQNNSLVNIKSLLELKNSFRSLKNRYDILTDEKINELNNFIDFVNIKLEFYQSIHALEKEEQLLLKTNTKESLEKKPDVLLEKTNSEIILERLNEYGFSELEMLASLEINSLVKHIFSDTKLPYQIAYLWHLNFIEKIAAEHCDSKKDLHELLGKIIGADERAIRGNVNGLDQEKSADRNRYTAYLHVEKVKIHYQNIK